MTLDYKSWGRLAAFGPGNALLGFSNDIEVSRDDARIALGRDADFVDTRTMSWGRLTLAEAERLIAYGSRPESVDTELAEVRELFSLAGVVIVTLYYSDPWNGY